MTARTGWSSYHALQTAFTKRLSNRWQASATYTLAASGTPRRRRTAACPRCRSRPRRISAASSRFDATDQRHRAVFNGIWQVGRGFQVSGLFYLGVGERAVTSYGGDLRGFGAAGQRRACVRTARSSRATALRSRRGSASTCASSSGFRCRPRGDRRDRRGLQRVQFSELDHQHGGEQRAVRPQHRGGEPDGAVRVPADVLNGRRSDRSNRSDRSGRSVVLPPGRTADVYD